MTSTMSTRPRSSWMKDWGIMVTRGAAWVPARAGFYSLAQAVGFATRSPGSTCQSVRQPRTDTGRNLSHVCPPRKLRLEDGNHLANVGGGGGPGGRHRTVDGCRDFIVRKGVRHVSL